MRKIGLFAAAALAAVAAVLMLPGSGPTTSAPGSGAFQHAAVAPVMSVHTVSDVRSADSAAAASLASAESQAGAESRAGAESQASAAGGLCSVPGIGDIGGLLGFCALGSSGLAGDLNNICQPALPTPEPADSGIDSMIAPPETGRQPATLYAEYGVAGDYWAATNLQCSDMTSQVGNDVAGMVFDAAKSIDRVTITVYQAAAGDGIVDWLQNVTDKLITSLGKAIYFPYLAVVVILAAIWLAWQGLIRKRATRTIEGTVWMIVACAAALFLIGRPAAVTGLGREVSDGIGQALSTAFANLPSPGPSSCVPVLKGDPQVQPATYSYTSGGTVVDQNADELWTVLVCKPWLVGEFGTSVYTTGNAAPTAVNKYGRQLLWAQAIAADEKATPALIEAKQAAYAGIASSIQTNDPAIYPLFQGNQWTTRLEVAFAALFAALVAGVLVLLIAVTLILLKLSFLLLLIVGPFFLLIGTHPGFGRVVALRWVEMLVGVLLKQAAVALVLSLLLYCYTLIMGTSDAVLPWALKILMIALVTVAAFIYRKPFQHLFSAVGYGMIGSPRAEVDLARAGATARAGTLAAALAVPSMAAGYRAARWTRRNPQTAGLGGAGSAGAAAAAGVAAGVQAGEPGAAGDGVGSANGAAAGAGGGGPAGGGAAGGGAGSVGSGADGAAGRVALASRGRANGDAAQSSAAQSSAPPPLNLPPRNGASSAGAGSVSSGPSARPAAGAGAGFGAGAGVGAGRWPSAGSLSGRRAAGGSASGSSASGSSASGSSASGRGASGGGPSGNGTSSGGIAGGGGAAGPGRPSGPGSWPLSRSASGTGSPSVRRPEVAPPRQPSASSPVGPAAGNGQQRPQPQRQQRLRRPGRGQQAQDQQAQRQQVQRQQVQRQQVQRQQIQGQQAQRQQAQRRAAAQGGSRPARGRAQPVRDKSAQGSPTWAQPVNRSGGTREPGSRLGQSELGQSEQGQSAQGQSAQGPLAQPSAERDRLVPFWLRSIRRK